MSFFLTHPNNAKAVRRGDDNPQLQRQVARYSQSSGWVFDQQYRGLSLPKMEGLAQQYAEAGCDFTFTLEHGIAQLETSDSRGTLSIDIWEVVHNRTLISTFKNPRNIAAIPANELALLAFAEKEGITDLSAAAEAFNLSAYLVARYPGVTDAIGAAAKRLWERIFLFREDATFYDIYSLRHTCQVSNRWPYNIAETNRNCIYTPAQFYSEAQDPDLWIFPMPQPIVNLLESSPVPDGPPATFDNYGYFLWGFLKSGSPRVTAANNTSNIVTQYDQFLWNTDEYGTL